MTDETDEPKASEPLDQLLHGAGGRDRDSSPEFSPDQKQRIEQEWRNLALTVIAATKSPLKYSGDAIVEMAQSQKRFSEELCNLATRNATREELNTVDKRHVKDAARDLHTRRGADWVRAFGMFFLALAIAQWIRVLEAQAISLNSVNILVTLMIIALAFLVPAIHKERPWRLPIRLRKRERIPARDRLK